MLVTPRLSRHGGERLRLNVSPEDWAKTLPSKRWKAHVTDLDTGTSYDIKAAPCGFGCHCDAIVVKSYPADAGDSKFTTREQ